MNANQALLRDLGIKTPEAAQTLAAEMRKAATGEYGFFDMGEGGVHRTREQVFQKYGFPHLAPGFQKDATNQIGVATPLGLLGVPLEVPAKLLYAVPTPLRNRLPRENAGGASVTFRKITAINSTNVWGSVAEATDSTTGRNSRIAYNEANVTYNFKSIEQETMLTPEALFGSNSKITPGQDFQAEDIARLTLLHATMLAEEKMILGGNVATLGATGASPALGNPVGLATGIGSLTAATNYFIRVSALSLRAYLAGASGNGGADAAGETPAGNELSRTTATGGSTGDKSINVTWPAIKGAVAYNVYFGTTTGNANCKFIGTVFVNQATVISTTLLAAAYNTTAVTAPDVHSNNVGNTADQSANALDYDGLIAQCTKASFSPGYSVSLDGATLTGDSTGGVNEVDVAFKAFYDTFKIAPDELWVNTAQKKKIDQIAVGSSAPVYRIDVQAGDLNVTGSLGVRSVQNRYMGKETPVTVHPFLAPGTILFVSYGLGPYYAGANVGDNIRIVLGWDYRSITFGLVKRAVEMGMDLNGALVIYGNFACGALQNVA